MEARDCTEVDSGRCMTAKDALGSVSKSQWCMQLNPAAVALAGDRPVI